MRFNLLLGACTLLSVTSALATEVNGFPEGCSEASTREALPGHIIRLGSISDGPNGLYFAFPDENDRDNLQTIDLAENVGLMGQDPNQDLSAMIQNTTPNGSFVVAQVFVADDSQEPVVTCLSQVMPLTRYVPGDFGPEWSWLDRGYFIERLRYKKYHRHWGWRKWWKNKFYDIGHRFKKHHGDRFRFRRDRDRNRGDRDMIIRRDRDRNRTDRDMIIRRDRDTLRGDKNMIIRRDRNTDVGSGDKMIIRKPKNTFNRDTNRMGDTFKNRERTFNNNGESGKNRPINPNTVRIERGMKDKKPLGTNTMVFKRGDNETVNKQ